MTKLEKLEMELKELRATVAALEVNVKAVGLMRPITELQGLFKDDPEMKSQLAAEREERERQRQREFAIMDRRELRSGARTKATARKKKVA